MTRTLILIAAFTLTGSPGVMDDRGQAWDDAAETLTPTGGA